MPHNPSDSGFLQIILLAVFLAIAILFLLTQQNTLKAVQPKNRLMEPGQVWLQLIPLFGQVWQFVVVTRIADSLAKERMSFQDDSIVGLPDYTAAEKIGERPTYSIGIIYCILCVIDLLLTYTHLVPTIQAGIGLSMMVCWVIYWVKLTAIKREMLKLKLAAGQAG